MKEGKGIYLGLDSSTQSLTATAVGDDLRIIHRATVNYDASFPQFETNHGMLSRGKKIVSNALMWVCALDSLLERLQSDGKLDFKSTHADGVSHCPSLFNRF